MEFEEEVVVNRILPAVRSILADRLSSEYGYTQEEIAVKLGTTQAAVSQYINGSRGDRETVEKITSDPQTDILVQDIVSKTAKDEDYTKILQDLVETIRDKGMMKESFRDTDRIS